MPRARRLVVVVVVVVGFGFVCVPASKGTAWAATFMGAGTGGISLHWLLT